MGSAGFFPLTLLSIVFVFASCSRVLGADEGYNANPCLALYHPEVLAEKARPLGALSTWSDPTPHNYRPKARAFDAKKVDCRVYHAMLGFNELPVAESDAFAIEVVRPFFADASTAEVLHLELQNILPRKGKITVSYDIRRADLGGRHEAPALPPSSGLPYRLSEVSSFTESFGGGQVENGLLLTATVPQDVGDMASLAARIRSEHGATRHAEVKMIVASPSCKLCTRKEINYFF